MNPFDLGLGGRQHYHANVASLARDPSAALLIAFGTPVPQLRRAEQHAHFAIAAVEAARPNSDLPVLYLSAAPLFELGIDSPLALRAAWERVGQRVARIPGVALEGFLLAPYIHDGIEAFLGFTRDPEFGPTGVIGPGGVQAELYGQAAMRHLPLPLTPAKVAQAVETSMLGKLVHGYRGQAPVDVDAFVRLVVEAARIVVDLGTGLRELDLNPVRIRTAGQGAWPLDALCVSDD